MSYIDDVLGGVISEGETLVRGYVNDALDPIGELIIDGMQAIGLLDSLESEWQKFEREELANYKGGFTPEELKSRYQDVLSEKLEQYVADRPDTSQSLNTPWRDKHINERMKKFIASRGEDAQGIFSLSKPVPGFSFRPLWRHEVPDKAATETVLMQRRAESEYISRTLKGMSNNTREFLEKLNANNLLAGRAEDYRYNHKLELMGKLDFSYPTAAFKEKNPTEPGQANRIQKDGETFNVFSLPFFENPKISESRAATYTNNVIINRNEPYKVWMGAKGKQVNLDFNISMTHLMTFASQQFKELTSYSVHEDGMRARVLEIVKQQNDARSDVPVSNRVPLFAQAPLESTSLEDVYQDTNDILTNPNTHAKGLGDSQSFRAQVIVYTVYLLDMIRTSVIGSTKWPDTPTHGRKLTHPPITFLSFGALYHEEPFIVKSYDLTFDGKNGYEELSLLPRTINIKLKLESYDQLKESQVVQGLSKRYYLS